MLGYPRYRPATGGVRPGLGPGPGRRGRRIPPRHGSATAGGAEDPGARPPVREHVVAPKPRSRVARVDEGRGDLRGTDRGSAPAPRGTIPRGRGPSPRARTAGGAGRTAPPGEGSEAEAGQSAPSRRVDSPNGRARRRRRGAPPGAACTAASRSRREIRREGAPDVGVPRPVARVEQMPRGSVAAAPTTASPRPSVEPGGQRRSSQPSSRRSRPWRRPAGRSWICRR